MDDELGHIAAGAALDPTLSKERPHTESHVIAKAFDFLKILFDLHNPERRFGARLPAKTAVKRLLSFWEDCTIAFMVAGFTDRFVGEEHSVLVSLFKDHWTAKLIEDLDAGEASRLAAFLSRPEEAVSPRASPCRA